MNTGWIRVHRNIVDNWIFKEPRYLKMWLTVLLYVNHSESKFNVGSDFFICSSGQSYRTLETWATLFDCSKNTAKRFFELLKTDGMITIKILGKGNQRKSLLTVANWEKYQNSEPKNEPENDLETKPETDQKRNRKRVYNNNEKNEQECNNEKNENILSSFDVFWNLYDFKIGKNKAFKAWQKINPKEYPSIFEHVPKYKASVDSQFQKHPTTYLNNECWNDEIKTFNSTKELPTNFNNLSPVKQANQITAAMIFNH